MDEFLGPLKGIPIGNPFMKVTLQSLHPHPDLERQLKLSRFNLREEHVIVDEKAMKEGQEAIKIVGELLADKGELPLLLGLSTTLDKKIHDILKEE